MCSHRRNNNQCLCQGRGEREREKERERERGRERRYVLITLQTLVLLWLTLASVFVGRVIGQMLHIVWNKYNDIIIAYGSLEWSRMCYLLRILEWQGDIIHCLSNDCAQPCVYIYTWSQTQTHNIYIFPHFFSACPYKNDVLTHTHTHTHSLSPFLTHPHTHPHSLPHSLTCKQKLVSCDSLDNVQHVASQGDIGTLGLTFKLLQHLSKDRVLLCEFLQRLESFVKLANVLGVKLQVGCPAQKDVSNSRVGGPKILWGYRYLNYCNSRWFRSRKIFVLEILISCNNIFINFKHVPYMYIRCIS